MRGGDNWDVVILGGGLTGAAAGVLLVKAGRRVAMLDGFPWEWWLEDESDAPANHCGGVLYGVPGYAPLTTLLIELGIPLNTSAGEGPVSFSSLEPGFQVLTPRRWVNFFAGPGEPFRELERLFPGESGRVEPLWEAARAWHQKQENYWPLNLDGSRREGGTSLSALLDGWAAWWSTMFNRGAAGGRLLSGFGDGPLAETMRLFLFGFCRRPARDAVARDLYDALELTSRPSCLVNEGGQRGLFHCLRASFQRAGGTIFRTSGMPDVEASGRGVTISGGGRTLTAGWLLADAPEAEVPALTERLWPRRRPEALRPAVQVLQPVPWEAVPAGMGGHLAMDLDGEGPFILTLAPAGERAILEVLAPRGDGEGDPSARILARVRKLFRFLPRGLPLPVVRRGWFPSWYGPAGFAERLRYPGPALTGPNLHREGRCFLVGRGDYLGSDLNGSLTDGRELALWLLHRTRSSA